MLNPYFCNGNIICEGAWWFIVIFVILFVTYKLIVPKKKKL